MNNQISSLRKKQAVDKQFLHKKAFQRNRWKA